LTTSATLYVHDLTEENSSEEDWVLVMAVNNGIWEVITKRAIYSPVASRRRALTDRIIYRSSGLILTVNFKRCAIFN
jgi:hypothetical protein